MVMRKRLSLWLIAALLLCMVVPGALAEATTLDLAGKLVILHTNDIHGRAVTDADNHMIGYAAIAQLKEDLEAVGASVLLLDAGDAMQGMPIVNLSHGETAMEFMNATGYDAMTLGNHEFDWGLDSLLQVSALAEFPILAANIVDKISNELIFQANTTFEMPNGMKVGVFGLDTPETLTKTHPDKVKGITFLMADELYACAQAQIDALKAEGCDVIICLGHLGVNDESAPNRSIDVIENTTGLDLFIDGHSHTRFDNGEVVGDTLLVSTGAYCEFVGVAVYDAGSFTASLHNGLDPDVAQKVNAVNADVEAALGAVFAKTEVALNGERDPGVRTGETNWGDLACDAILWSAQQSVGDHVVAAITNGGNIRASLPVGDITMKDMKVVFPYDNQVTVLTVTGAELLEALEAATFATPTPLGAFPQVAGIEMIIDATVPYEDGELYPDSTYHQPAKPGSRVTIKTVGGEPFDLDAHYVIASNDFTAAGGDTYYAFKYAFATSGYLTGVSLEDAVINYIDQVLNKTIDKTYDQPQGRITIVK